MSFIESIQGLNESYWALKETYEAGSVPCFDEECEGTAEPERDGDHTYYSCVVCGSDFGYERVPDEAAEQDSCAIGVPVAIRQQFTDGLPETSTPVQIGRKP